MVSQFVGYTPTASQWASAAIHLERKGEWRTFRVDGVRYVALVSGCSGHVYLVRATADECSCPWYTQTGRLCSHMLSLELAALEDELTQERAAPALLSLRDLFPGCANGCGNVTEGNLFCDDCASAVERTQRMESQRAAVVARYL